MSLITRSSSSSDRSSFYWSTPDSPISPNSFYALRGFILHDRITDTPRMYGHAVLSSADSSATDDDSSAQRRHHIFGTPTSQAGTVDDVTSTDSKVEDAYGDVGMDMLRDARGSGVGSRGSEGLSGSIRSLLSDEIAGPPIARGGLGRAAWVMLDQPSTVVPDIPGWEAGRRPSVITTSDGATSQKSDRAHSPEDLGPTLPTSSPLLARRSLESKFSEDLPKTRQGSTPILWIKRRVRGRTNSGDTDNITVDGNKKGKNIPRKPTQSLGVMVLPETTEPSSRSNINLQAQSSSQSGDTGGHTNAPGSRTSSDVPFLNQVDDGLVATRPGSRLRKFSTTVMEVGRKFSAATPQIRKVPRVTSSYEISYTQPTPRSKSVPPQQKRNSVWDLEFLPSEAQGVKTPTQIPVFNTRHIGGKVMPLPQEKKYFNLADMVQSQPPLAPAEEAPTHLNPKEGQAVVTSSTSISNFYSESDCRAIAPFITQDQQRSPSPVFSTARDGVLATGRKIRRASLQARNALMPRKLSDVSECEVSLSRRGTNPEKSHNPTQDAVPGRVRSGRGVVKWIKRASSDSGASSGFSGSNLRRGQYESELEIVKPAEVIIEEARREKRDTRIIGLDPSANSSSTDDSFTYTSALQDIAGLSKRPKGPITARTPVQALEVGELVTPPPPGFPRNNIVPGSLIRGGEIS